MIAKINKTDNTQELVRMWSGYHLYILLTTLLNGTTTLVKVLTVAK